MAHTPAPNIADYYRGLGLSPSAWEIGPEHPSLEQLGLRVLAGTNRARILELGVQSGGFAVPVILAAAARPQFAYTGVDNLQYTNAVPLRLIEEYLRLAGVTAGLRFIEGDSTPVLRTMPPSSFDLILIDHYKPKYPLDLYLICSRNLLSDDGVIVLHDVLTHAAGPWKVCVRVCRAFGYSWVVDANVSQGAAVVHRNRGTFRARGFATLVGIEVRLRWYAHAAVLAARRHVGRVLRALGLR